MSTAVVPLRTGGKVAGIIPTSIEEVFRLAKAISASGLAPRDMSTPEKLTVAIMHGLEIGIPPMMAVNKIAVVNGRPTLWGDAIPALLLSNGFKLRERFVGDGDARVASCLVIRPDGEKIERQFSVADAKTAGLWGKQGPWKQYPDRMLQMRARGLAARDGAADVLSGLYLGEEIEDDRQPTVTITATTAPPSVPMDDAGVPTMDEPAEVEDVPAIPDDNDEPFALEQEVRFLDDLKSELAACPIDERESLIEARMELFCRLSDAGQRKAEAIIEGRS